MVDLHLYFLDELVVSGGHFGKKYRFFFSFLLLRLMGIDDQCLSAVILQQGLDFQWI